MGRMERKGRTLRSMPTPSAVAKAFCVGPLMNTGVVPALMDSCAPPTRKCGALKVLGPLALAAFPTVEIERDLVGRGRAARDRAERGGLREGDGSAHERIAAEELDALRVRRRSEQEYGENESAD